MYHSITFGDKNTWDDWHLVPSSRPLVNPPITKTEYVEIPGADGSVDYTEILGGVKYRDRTGSWEFIVMNGYADWTTTYSNILEYLHGKKMKVWLEDDPYFYYNARLSVNGWNSSPSDGYSKITIDYVAEPYKYESGSGEDWLWDPFSFPFGIIRNYNNLFVNGQLTFTVIGSPRVYTPMIISSASMKVVFDNTEYDLMSGNNYIPDIRVVNGNNQFIFIGNGTVSIHYQGGRL